MLSKQLRKALFVKNFFAIMMCMVFSFDVLAATTTLRWCTSWRAMYTDASTTGSGFEDWLTIPAGQNYVDVSAQYSQYRVWRWNGSSWVFDNKEGFLNYYDSVSKKYCTDLMTLTQGTMYQFRQYTQSGRDNRAVVVMHPTSTWSAPDRMWMGANIVVGTETMLRSTPATTAREFSAMGIVRQLLALAPTLDWTSDVTDQLYLNQDPNDCPKGACYYGDAVAVLNSGGGAFKHPICAPTTISSINKTITAHELGHGMAMMRGGPGPTNYDADVSGKFADQMTANGSPYTSFKDPPSYTVYNPLRNTCICQPGYSHCIQSREYIGAAQGEAYANFVATSLFNNREAESWFNYYKQIYHGPNPYPADTSFDPWLRWDGQSKWIQNKCWPLGTDFGGLGSELDWGQFYWQLWATGTENQKFSFNDIHDVYRGRWDGGTLKGGVQYTFRCCSSTSSCNTATITGPDGKPACSNSSHTVALFGPLWDQRSSHPPNLKYLVNSVRDIWGVGSDKYLRFTSLGNATGINY